MKPSEKIIQYQRSLDCVHCGLCLPVCPTYALSGKESASPRGRIYLMRAIAEDRLPIEAPNIVELDRCLVCRACETVCPSGVQFGEMMEITRDQIEETGARSRMAHALKRWFFRSILPKPRRLRFLVTLLWLYQRSGLRWLARFLGIPHLFGYRTALRDAMSPNAPAPWNRRAPEEITPATGERRARVGFLVGCVAQELLPEANDAAISVLRRNGCEVNCPKSRPCCGALATHFGDLDAARALAARCIESFPDSLDAIVVSSAGCAAAMKEYARLFDHDPALQAKAKRFSSRVKDFNEFLVSLPFRAPRGELAMRVAYDEPCHLVHAQHISSAPKQILASIPKLELVPFTEQEVCCGAAGLYTVTCPEQSLALLERKIEKLKSVMPQCIATANPGCHLQLKRGAEEWLPGTEVLHVAELLERSYRAEGGRAPS